MINKDKSYKLSKIMDNVFKHELSRQFKRDKLMNVDEFRSNVTKTLFSLLSKEEFNFFKNSIWNEYCSLECELLLDKVYGDKLLRCIYESGLPFINQLVINHMRDINKCLEMINTVPSLTDYILDTLSFSINKDDIEGFLNLVAANNKNDELKLFEENMYDAEYTVLERFSDWCDVNDMLDMYHLYNDLLDLDVINSSVVNDEEEFEDNSVSSSLTTLLTDQIEFVISEITNGTMSKVGADQVLFSMGLNVLTDFKELVDTNEGINNVLKTKHKFYKFAQTIDEFIRSEVVDWIIEQIDEKRKQLNVKNILANLVNYYFTKSCIK